MARVSRASIYNWQKDENFKTKLQSERNLLFIESLDLLRQGSMKAVQVLYALLNSDDETTRRLTAKEVLNQALKITELRDLEERITKIEKALDYKNHNST